VRHERLGAVGLFLAASLVVVACGSSSAAPKASSSTAPTSSAPSGKAIPISVICSSGVYGTQEVCKGAQAAVDAINAGGGVRDPAGGPNQPFKLISCDPDPTTDPNADLQCAHTAISAGVVADVGRVSNGTDETTAFANAGIPMLGTSPTGAQDYANNHVFPFSGGAVSVAAQGKAAQAAGATTLALITYDVPTGRELSGLIASGLTNKADLLLSVYLPVDPSADISSFIAQVVNKKPDGVVVAVSQNGFGQVFNALHAAGYKGKILTGSSIATPKVVRQLGSAANGVVIVSEYDACTDTSNATIRQFNSELDTHAPGISKNQYSINAWLSVHVLKDVIEHKVSGDVTSASILSVLPGYQVNSGISPAFTLGATVSPIAPRVPRFSFQLQTVANGQIVKLGAGNFITYL
jgi:ABC-type branched-subunit amino acid transport system substrate-binding protein